MARVYERAAYEAALIAGNMPEMDEGAEEVLAAVRELAVELRVNPNTVQRALAELERRGLARSERTAGRFVTDDASLIDEARNDLAAGAAADYARRAQRLGMSLTAARELLGQQWRGAIEGEDA